MQGGILGSIYLCCVVLHALTIVSLCMTMSSSVLYEPSSGSVVCYCVCVLCMSVWRMNHSEKGPPSDIGGGQGDSSLQVVSEVHMHN